MRWFVFGCTVNQHQRDGYHANAHNAAHVNVICEYNTKWIDIISQFDNNKIGIGVRLA